MFGMGMGELLLILVVALLALGPDKLPNAAKSIGKAIRDFRKQTKELQSTLEQDTKFGEAVREIKSAMYDDPSRPRPRPKPQPVTPPESPPDAQPDPRTHKAAAGPPTPGTPATASADDIPTPATPADTVAKESDPTDLPSGPGSPGPSPDQGSASEPDESAHG